MIASLLLAAALFASAPVRGDARNGVAPPAAADRPRDELSDAGRRGLKPPAVAWHVVRWDKKTWADDLVPVYTKARAEGLPVAILFYTPDCSPDGECHSRQLARTVLQSFGFRAYAGRAVFVLARIDDETLADKAATREAFGFVTAWNVGQMPTLVLADPTPAGLRERARITGRHDPDEYLVRMAEAFDPKGTGETVETRGPKAAAAGDLARMLGELPAAADRTPDGGVRTVMTVGDGPKARPMPVLVRPTADGRRVAFRVALGPRPAGGDARAEFDRTLAYLRSRSVAFGPAELTVEGSKAFYTLEVFNDFDSTGRFAHTLRRAAFVASALWEPGAEDGGK